MGGSNTFGGTIKLEGEKAYRQAISQINSDLKVFSSEIVKLTAEFGKNDTSTKGLTERNKVLTEQIDKQKEKIAALKGAVEDSAQKYGEHDKKTNNWKTSLNKAEAELTQMKKELESNNKQLDANEKGLDNCSNSLKDFSKSEDEAGQKALKFGDLVKANLLSDAIIGGIKKLGESITKVKDYLSNSITAVASYGDNILTMSTQTGLSTQALQEYSAVAELVDVDVETMTKSMAKNIKSMTSAANGTGTTAEAYKKLGISVTDSNGSLRDGETVYKEVIDALGAIPNETERDSIAMQILGKSAQDLNPLIAQGSAGMAELTKKAYEMGAVLSDDTVNSLGAMDDSMQIFKGTVASTSNLLGATLAPAITEIMTGVNGLAGAFNEIIAAVLKDGDIDTAVQKFSDMSNQMVQNLTSAVPKLLEIGGNLMGTLMQGLTAAFPSILQAAGQIIPEIITGIASALPQLAGAATMILTMLVSSISRSLPILIPAIVEAVVVMAQTLIDNIDLIIQAGIGLLMGLVKAIPEIIKILIPKIPDIVKSVVNALVENVPVLLAAAIELFMALVQAIPEIVVTLAQNLPQIVSAIIGGLARLPELIWNVLAKCISKFMNWGGQLFAKGTEAAQNLVSGIWNTVCDLPGRMFDIGKNLVQGIWNGINNAKDWILNKIAEFGQGILKGIKSFFGIASPSKLFEEQVGKNLALGVGDGFTASMKNVSRQMQNAIPTSFETDLNVKASSTKETFGINTGNPPQAVRNETIIHIENFVNNRQQDVQAFAQELEFYLRRNSFALG